MKLAQWFKKDSKATMNNIQKKKSKKRMAFIGAVLVVGAAGFYYISSSSQGLPVEGQAADRGTVMEYVEETAYAKSKNERIIYSDVNGILGAIAIEEGDGISKGDVLASIEGNDLDLQIKSLSSQLSGAQASASYAYVQSSQLAENEAARTLENIKKLYGEGAVSEDDYLKAQAAYDSAVQAYRQALSQYSAAKAQADTISYEIDLLENNRNKLTITTDEDTMVTRVYVKEGEYVTAGMPLFELGNMEELYLETDILVSDVSSLETGQKVLIDNEDIGLEEIAGSVAKISPKAFSKVSELGIEQKRVRVEIESEALKNRVRLGYEVDVRIITRSMEDVLRVPDNAVFESDAAYYVFKIQDGKAILTQVDVIFEGNDYFAIENGIAEGDMVVLSPGNELEEGAKVSLIED